jgi:hypothetical protein
MDFLNGLLGLKGYGMVPLINIKEQLCLALASLVLNHPS